LTIVDVNVKAIDYSARYLYPNRTVEIKTSERNITTPIRAATSYEYHEKAKVPTDIPINNPIFINIEKLDYSRFEKLLKTNHYFAKIMRKIDLNNRLAQYSNLRLTLLQPTVTSKRDPKTGEKIRDSPMEHLKQNPALREKFLRFIIRLQQEVGLNPITIPFLELPFHTFQETVTQVSKSLEKINLQTIFFVDINYTDFEPAIELLANELQSKMIGLIFRRYRSFPLSYEALSKYIDRDIVFFAVQVYRYDSYYDDISTMHYLPFFGNDIYAVETPAPYGSSTKGEQVEPPKDRLQYVRLFDKESLRVVPIAATQSTLEKLKDEYHNDIIIRSIIDNFHEARTDDSKYKVLRAFSKVNELHSSSSEFERFQDYVRQNSTKDYIQEKRFLQTTLQKAKQYSVERSPSKQAKLM